MAFTETLKERQAIAAATVTTLNNTSITTGNGMNMGMLRRARAFLRCGTLTGAASVDFKLQASATSGGSYSDITNNTTNPTLTAITTDDSLNALEIRADQMPAGKPWLRAIATETASANAVVDLLLIGDESGYKPAAPAFSTYTLTNDVVTAT